MKNLKQIGGSHYDKSIDAFDVAAEYNLTAEEMSAVKYVIRKKGGRLKKAEDLYKAINSLEKELFRNYSDIELIDGITKFRNSRFKASSKGKDKYEILDSHTGNGEEVEDMFEAIKESSRLNEEYERSQR